MNTKFRLFEQKLFHLLSSGERVMWLNMKQKGILRDEVVTYIQSHMANLTITRILKDPNKPRELKDIYDMSQLRKITGWINRVEDFWKMQTIDNSDGHVVSFGAAMEAHRSTVEKLEEYLGYNLLCRKAYPDYSHITTLFQRKGNDDDNKYEPFNWISALDITSKIQDLGFYPLKSSPMFPWFRAMWENEKRTTIGVYFKEENREEIESRIYSMYQTYLQTKEAGSQKGQGLG